MHSVLFCEMNKVILVFYRKFFKHSLFQNTISGGVTDYSRPELFLVTNENHSFDSKWQKSIRISPWCLCSLIHNTNIRPKWTVLIKFEWINRRRNYNVHVIYKIIVAFHINRKENIRHFLSSLKLFNFIHYVLCIVVFCSVCPDYLFVKLLINTEHICLLVHFLQCFTTVIDKHVYFFHL